MEIPREFLGRPMYMAMVEMANKCKGQALDINVHRYRAMAHGVCVGYFSSLQLAFAEVDLNTRQGGVAGTMWDQTAAGVGNHACYVLDTLQGRVFARVARRGDGEEEEEEEDEGDTAVKAGVKVGAKATGA